MQNEFAVVDLFAGPGGLAEGFSSIKREDGSRPFKVVLSVEKENSAFETLRLRSFLRQFPDAFPKEYYDFLNNGGEEPDWNKQYPIEWSRACHETLKLELGSSEASQMLNARLKQIHNTWAGNVVLVGGPPCQAYSLVGRVRNKGIKDYDPGKDHRHFLYKEYIRILERLRPAAFVMENVKGLLSSSVNGERVFERVLDDLSAVGQGTYRLVSLSPRSRRNLSEHNAYPLPRDFVVRAEDFGVPQARHRVIVVGLRADIASVLDHKFIVDGLLQPAKTYVSIKDVMGLMPKLRSGLSVGNDSDETWRKEVARVMRSVASMPTQLPREAQARFRMLAGAAARSLTKSRRPLQRMSDAYALPTACPPDLRQWLGDRRLKRFPNHQTRSHMLADLGRYFFASLYGKVSKTSPRAADFPPELAPRHRNWKSGKFNDRFRVQLLDGPATTITSHISKDGHYFIHPDPDQCRSLTVREAARLQTFPDNYFFKGNRTEQFVQVGNAVPPFLAGKIAVAIHGLLERAEASTGSSIDLKRTG